MARKPKAGGFGPQGEERMKSQDFETGMIKVAEPVSRRSQKIFRVAAWTFITIFLVTNVSNCSQQIKTQTTQAELEKQVSDTYNPSFKVRYEDLGAQVIGSWYKGTPPPVNISKDMSWPSNTVPATVADTSTGKAPVADSTKGKLVVTDVAFLNGSQITDPTQSFYQERLNYYALVNGVPQQVSVTLGMPKDAKIDNYPILIAAPSLLPYRPAGQSSLGSKPNKAEAQLSEDAVKAIDTWAKSYTTNNSTSLKQITGDSNPDNAYTGLGSGWEYVAGTSSDLWSIVSDTESGSAIARVTWKIKAPDVTIPPVGGSNTPTMVTGATQTQTMDVMIGGFKSGSPTVQAWGPAGTYMELKSYQNAINTKSNQNNQVNPEDNLKPPTGADPKEVAPTAPVSEAPTTPAP